MKRALILGISGQDGAYLARHLLKSGYHVFGTMPDASTRRFRCLRTLGIFDRIPIFQLSLQDYPAIVSLFKSMRLDEIYNFSSHVECGAQGEDLRVCEPDLERGTLNILEAIRSLGQGERFLLAASGEASDLSAATRRGRPAANRGRVDPALEEEALACRHVAEYRENHGIYACTGVIYNRASPLAPHYALSKKIISSAARIAAGHPERLTLPYLDEIREWGWAPEYADAIQRVLQQETPEDFVIATGIAHPVREFTEAAFAAAGLDWTEFVDEKLNGPADTAFIPADPSRALNQLGWKAEIGMERVASLLISSERISSLA